MSLSLPPSAAPFDTAGSPTKEWVAWIQEAHGYISKHQGFNTTANRPINGMKTGDMFFDTTLVKPIWYSGSGWVDATGASV